MLAETAAMLRGSYDGAPSAAKALGDLLVHDSGPAEAVTGGAAVRALIQMSDRKIVVE